MKNIILDYQEFILEGLVDRFTKSIDIDFDIEADEHFFNRLTRIDNELDEEGNTVIDEAEVKADIKKAIRQIVKKNLFNDGLFWDHKNRNELNKEIRIRNDSTKLNIIVMISKFKDKGEYKYKFTIKTVMRKDKFEPSNLQKKAEPIYV